MTDNPHLTITLTGARPIKILRADWPIIAEATEHLWEGEHEFQSHRHSRASLRVRQHADGRAIVYGAYHYETQWQGERSYSVRGGDALHAGDEIADAIASVARDLAGRIWEDRFGLDMIELGQKCMADLPAVEV